MKPSERTSEGYLQDIVDFPEKAERFMASIPYAEARARDEKTLRRSPERSRSPGKWPSMSLRLFVGNTPRSRGAGWPECAPRSFVDTSEWTPQSSGGP
jgi:hypothetical protein